MQKGKIYLVDLTFRFKEKRKVITKKANRVVFGVPYNGRNLRHLKTDNRDDRRVINQLDINMTDVEIISFEAAKEVGTINRPKSTN
jgi:hypothetical protein